MRETSEQEQRNVVEQTGVTKTLSLESGKTRNYFLLLTLSFKLTVKYANPDSWLGTNNRGCNVFLLSLMACSMLQTCMHTFCRLILQTQRDRLKQLNSKRRSETSVHVVMLISITDSTSVKSSWVTYWREDSLSSKLTKRGPWSA